MDKSDFLPVYDLTPFTMQDFPDRTSCIIWISGCNMRCAYCHNPAIVKGGAGKIDVQEVLSFLERRRGLLEGVVLSGGEATLYKGIVSLARRIKNMGFALKLDTNGTRPAVLRQLLDEGLLNYIALDYKAPAEKFKDITDCPDLAAFHETLDLLIRQKFVPVEIRTTIHTGLLAAQDIRDIMADLDWRGFSGKYYVQNYIPPPLGTLAPLELQQCALNQEDIPPSPRFFTDFRNFAAPARAD